MNEVAPIDKVLAAESAIAALPQIELLVQHWITQRELAIVIPTYNEKENMEVGRIGWFRVRSPGPTRLPIRFAN